MRLTTRAIITAALAASLIGTAAAAPRWLHYRTNDGSPVVVVVKARCIGAEDSAAHLRLLDYSADRAVYGCAKRGY